MTTSREKREAADSTETPDGSAIAGEQAAERPTVCLAANSDRRRTGQNTGLVMITEYDQLDKITEYHDDPDAKPGADPPPRTPEDIPRVGRDPRPARRSDARRSRRHAVGRVRRQRRR